MPGRKFLESMPQQAWIDTRKAQLCGCFSLSWQLPVGSSCVLLLEDNKGEPQAGHAEQAIDHILNICLIYRFFSCLTSEQQAGSITNSFCQQMASLGQQEWSVQR